MDTQLKHCPFCGGEARMIVLEEDGGYSANIYCSSDNLIGCFTRQFHWALKKEWAVETAINSWNRRTLV